MFDFVKPGEAPVAAPRRGNAAANKLSAEDRAAHDWYRFVLSFPPHLVRSYAERFGLEGGNRVLDPFSGTGTTIVECKKLGVLEPSSIDAVITSPPYPNEKDYTRTTRLETVILGFAKDKRELRELKNLLMRSNTRNVYKDDDDDAWVSSHPEIQRISEQIEARRVAMGKTSGFERLY